MSKFIWTENTSDGFKIVTSFSANIIKVTLQSNLCWSIYDVNNKMIKCYNLLDKFQVFDGIAEFISNWEEYEKIYRDKKKWKEKQIKMICKSTSKNLYKHYVKQATTQMNVLISTVEEKKIKLHKKVFSSLGPKHYKTFPFHKNFGEYLESDMIRSPAVVHTVYKFQYDSPEMLLSRFKNKNKNFNKTVFGLRKFSGKIVNSLFKYELFRDYDNFIEFYFAQRMKIGQECFDFQGREIKETKLDDFFAFSTKKEIRKSLDIYNRYTHNNLSLRKLREIDLLIHFLTDMPIDENFKGKLPEYTRRVCRWHDEENKKNLDKIQDGPTKLPAIPLPKSKNIIFLDTKRKIVNEGKVMRHCVGSYAKKAERGGCFIFHVDYNGESATVEVDHNGEVRQAYGPSNRVNKAATYGKRALNAWGKGLRPMSKEGCMVGTDENIPF